MNELKVIGISMTSLELSETTGKHHAHIMRDIRNEIVALGEINESIFGLVDYTDAKGEKRPCYTFGKDGAMQLALKYDAKTRYKVIKKLEELEKGQALRLPQSYEEMIIMQARSMQEFKMEVDIKFEVIEEKVDNQITLDHGKQRVIQKAVSKRVIDLLEGKESLDYRRYSKKYFAALYRDIKDRMGVPSYKDVKTKDYDQVREYIKHWMAPANIKEIA